MPRVGLRELKNQAAEILRQVREESAEYIVTYHGRPVAVILPIDEEFLAREEAQATQHTQPSAALWEEMDQLRQEIDASWQSDRTAVEIVSEQRR